MVTEIVPPCPVASASLAENRPLEKPPGKLSKKTSTGATPEIDTESEAITWIFPALPSPSVLLIISLPSFKVKVWV